MLLLSFVIFCLKFKRNRLIQLTSLKNKQKNTQVLDAVRAAEMLVSNMTPKSPGPNRADLKTTTIVMSKHTLAPQTSTVSTDFLFFFSFSFSPSFSFTLRLASITIISRWIAYFSC